MYEFDHPNVLPLRGVCLDGGTAPYIIMPFMANGSLLAYLKKKRETLVVSFSDQDEDNVRSMVAYCIYNILASYPKLMHR
jgi:serine/threonine protein kinase